MGSRRRTDLDTTRDIPVFDPLKDIAARVQQITEENKRLFRRLLQGERRYRTLARAVWRVQEEERRRLARELHDGIGQTLVGLRHRLLRIQEDIAKDSAAAGKLAEALDLAADALNDTRELSRLLRPPVLDDLGLEAALQWLYRTLKGTGLEITLDLRLDNRRLDAELETLVFRVVQEALTNVIKHSGADTAAVLLSDDGEQLKLVVSDAGCGFDTAALGEGRSGVGLRGIRDRIELFGGGMELKSVPGEGTTLSLQIPLDTEVEE